MSMSLSADFAPMFAESPDAIAINGSSIAGFIVRPDIIREPFYQNEAEEALYILVQKTALTALGQWPVTDPAVTLDGQTAPVYRVIRAHESAGHVQLFLQES